jgi:hypothetical protein
MSASSGEKVAARLSPPDSMRMRSRPGKAAVHGVHGREVDGAILADRRVRAAAGLDAHDALFRQRARDREEARVLLGVDVVRDGAEVVDAPEALAERLHERRLARTDGTADADAQGAVG